MGVQIKGWVYTLTRNWISCRPMMQAYLRKLDCVFVFIVCDRRRNVSNFPYYFIYENILPPQDVPEVEYRAHLSASGCIV